MMSESETIGHLIGYTSLLLGGVSVFFTIVSVYIAALNYFLRRTGLLARVGAFVFFSATLGMLMLIMTGARRTQSGLVHDLARLDHDQNGLSHTGRMLLENGAGAPNLPIFDALPAESIWREPFSLDGLVVTSVWGGLALTYVAVFLMTFVFRWAGAEAKPKRQQAADASPGR